MKASVTAARVALSAPLLFEEAISVDASNEKLSRRSALKAVALWVGALVVGAGNAWAKKEKKPIDPTKDAGAKALGYAHEAKDADAKKGLVAQYQKEGMNCSKCQFFVPGSDAKWGECRLLPQGLVSPNGLCMSFSKKS